MNKTPFLITFFIFLFLVSTAQHSEILTNTNVKFVKTKFSSENINNRGMLQYSFDLFNLNLGGVNYPINFLYSSKGNRVSDRPSSIGLGWILQADGMVSRHIHGRPDEEDWYKDKEKLIHIWDPVLNKHILTRNTIERIKQNNYSYFSRHTDLQSSNWKNQSFLNTLKQSYNLNFSPPTIPPIDLSEQDFNLTSESYINPKPDLSPDMFFFKIGAYSGKFFLDFNGEWKAISHNDITYKIQVELSIDSTFQYFNNPYTNESFNLTLKPSINKIILVSSDGYKFTFGGNNTTVGYSISDYSSGQLPLIKVGNVDYYRTPNQWKISKIENLRNLEYLSFTYEKSLTFTSSNVPYGTTPKIVFSPHYFYPTFWRPEIGYTAYNNLSSTARIKILDFLVKTISHSNGTKITFNYAELPQLYQGLSIQRSSHYFSSLDNLFRDERINKPKLMVSMSIQYGNTEQNYSFSYLTDMTRRPFLENVKLNNKFLYKFSYNKTLLPDYESRETDHWGYYNGKDFFSGKPLNYNSSASEIINYPSSMVPDTILNQAGLLTSIQDMNGLSMNIKYETNVFNKIYRLNDESFKDTTGFGPGVRVSKIVLSDRFARQEITYKYKGGVLSFGIPTQLYFNTNNTITLNKKNHLETVADNFSETLYSNIDIVSSDSSITSLFYTNINEVNKDTKYQGIYDSRLPSAYIDNSYKRGLLVKKVMKDNQGKVLLKHEYDYKFNREVVFRSIYSYFDEEIVIPIEQSFFTPLKRSETTVSYYNNNDSTKTVNDFTYSNNNQLVTQTIETSSNNIVEMQNYYITDITTNGVVLNSIYDKILKRSLLNLPLETVKKHNNKVIQATLIEYTERQGVIVPFRIYSIESENGIDDFQHATLSNGVLVKDSRYSLQKEISNTDKYGNATEVKELNKPTIVYLWGYHGQHQVAQVKNSTFSTIQSLLTQAKIEFLNQNIVSNEYIVDILKKLRASLPLSFVSGSAYKPLVGISCNVDSRGIVENYFYDEFGRITTVKDFENNIIKHNKYNLISHKESNNQPSFPMIYIKLIRTPTSRVLLDGDGDQQLHEIRGNISVSFYEDILGNTPYHVSDPNFFISLFIDDYISIYPPVNKPYVKLGTGVSTVLLNNVPLYEEFSQRNFTTNNFQVISTTHYKYNLLPSTKYTVIQN